MARTRKPFAQFSRQLPDGRAIVQVLVFEPRQARVWVVARSRSDALAQVRALGAPDPHVESLMRPSARVAEAAGADVDGGVFDTESQGLPARLMPISALPAYLAAEERGSSRSASYELHALTR